MSLLNSDSTKVVFDVNCIDAAAIESYLRNNNKSDNAFNRLMEERL